MDPLGDERWRRAIVPAITAELQRRYPQKLPVSCVTAAQRVERDLCAAWQAYHQGATAAIFDIVRMHEDVHVALPGIVSAEVHRLLRLALEGAGHGQGKGKRPPLRNHLANLVKRRRYEAVAVILRQAEAYIEDDNPTTGAIALGADPRAYFEWQRTRQQASGQVGDAATMAAEQFPDGAGPRTFADAFREVDQARRSRPWPGAYYLPSRATLTNLGWAASLPSLHALMPTDAPALHVG